MAYISKKNMLNAYKVLSTMSPDPNAQGATQKVSAIRYFLALDAFFKLHNKGCNTRNREDKDEFVKLVGLVSHICSNRYTPNFYFPLKQHAGDYSVGSNFFSAGQVNASLVNPDGIFDYPKRGNTPLLKIKDGGLIRDVSLYPNLNYFLTTTEFKVALVVWVIRKISVEYNNGKTVYENIYNALSNLFTKDLLDVLFVDSANFNSILENYNLTFNDNPYSLLENDISEMFDVQQNIEDDILSINSYQIIFYGAPGTGKSHRIKHFLNNKNVPKENIFRTTFHPDSDYSTFVGAYKPSRSQKPVYGLFGDKTIRLNDGGDLSEEVITYKFTPQAFLKAYIRAYQVPTENVYLVIEEINRGNCAQIFGDLFQLLDRDPSGKSDYTIKADDDMRTFLEDEFKNLGVGDDGIKDGELCLPSNLYVYATMNTSDQSLFPIDSAFKRRWDWEYEPIKYKNTGWKIDIDGTLYSWTEFQQEVNSRILKDSGSEDKMMGDYFVNPSTGIISKKLFLNKVLFYLWNDVCKDGDTDIFPTDNDFSFSKLHVANNTQVIKDIIERLGVKPIEEPESIDEEEEEEEEEEEKADISSTSKHKRLDGITLDGIKYEPTTSRFDLYLDIIKKIGLEKVQPIVAACKYKRLGTPLVTTEQYDEINNSQAFSYVQVGNYYVVKGISDATKINILQVLKEELNLNMEIEIG